jgi:hypothetical protein
VCATGRWKPDTPDDIGVSVHDRILMHIIAGATDEQLAAGRRPFAPYWRVVGNDVGWSRYGRDTRS